MKKSKLKKKKCSKWSHKVYNILFPTMFICGFFFFKPLCWSYTISDFYEGLWQMADTTPLSSPAQPAWLNMWRQLSKFSTTSQDRQPSRMRSEGWEEKKDRGWVLPSAWMGDRGPHTRTFWNTFMRTLLHNYLCSAPNVFFLCLGTGLPPLYSPKLRIIKKPLARSLSVMTRHKLNPSGAEKSQCALALPEGRWSYSMETSFAWRGLPQPWRRPLDLDFEGRTTPSRVVHSKLKDSDVNLENTWFIMTVTPSGSLLSEEDNTFNILMGKEEHFVKDLWEQGALLVFQKSNIWFFFVLFGGR